MDWKDWYDWTMMNMWWTLRTETQYKTRIEEKLPHWKIERRIIPTLLWLPNDVVPRSNFHRNVRFILWHKISQTRDMNLRKIGQILEKKISMQKEIKNKDQIRVKERLDATNDWRLISPYDRHKNWRIPDKIRWFKVKISRFCKERQPKSPSFIKIQMIYTSLFSSTKSI